MSFSGGVYTLPGPALVTGDTVSATENNQFRNDVAGAFNLTMLRNGTSTATANLPMGGYKLTGLGLATTSGDALSYGQAAVVSDITATGSITVNSGTANGVAYLNGSKVLTTGSALTFDGSSVFSAPRVRLANASRLDWGTGTEYIVGDNGGATLFGVANAEQMRLTSTGLGIGTSSPTNKLTIKPASNVAQIRLQQDNDAGSYTELFRDSSDGHFKIQNNGVTFADFGGGNVQFPNGNLGLGVTPSAWYSSFGTKAVQIGSYGGLSYDGYTGSTTLSFNAYQSGATAYTYLNNSTAARYSQLATGVHAWYTAPSGTAGNAISFTQAMTLDASGNLSLDGGGAFTLNNAKALAFKDSGGTSRWCAYMSGGVSPSSGNDLFVGNPLAANTVLFTNNTERMRIDSSGNVGIGTSSPNGQLSIFNGGAGLELYGGTGLNSGSYIQTYNRGASAYIPLTTYSSAFIVSTGTSPAERMRIDSSGSLLVGKTSSSVSGNGLVVESSGSIVTTIASSNTYHVYSSSSTSFRFYVNENGGISNYQANNTNLSDERTKTNIELCGNYLDKICSIPVKLFNYKDEAKGTQRTLGVIAQDVEKVAPEFVCNDGWLGEEPDAAGPLKTLYQTDMMFGLMKAIQELKAELDATKAEVAALKNTAA